MAELSLCNLFTQSHPLSSTLPSGSHPTVLSKLLLSRSPVNAWLPNAEADSSGLCPVHSSTPSFLGDICVAWLPLSPVLSWLLSQLGWLQARCLLSCCLLLFTTSKHESSPGLGPAPPPGLSVCNPSPVISSGLVSLTCTFWSCPHLRFQHGKTLSRTQDSFILLLIGHPVLKV